MNNVVLLGRLTKDPEIKHTDGDNSVTIAKYTLAVNREIKKENEPEADFINCVVFGKPAEFAEKWLKKGQLICVRGKIQTRNYTNKEDQKVYVTEIIIDKQIFAESKKDSDSNSNNESKSNKNSASTPPANSPKFDVPEDDDDLPF